MRGAIPPLLQYAFMAWYLVKHRDNFIFTLSLNGRGHLENAAMFGKYGKFYPSKWMAEK
jgi:hypothetical protein